jgi:hypothetical protein
MRARMYERRRKGYASIGYEMQSPREPESHGVSGP